MEYYDYHIKYHKNNNLIISEDPIEYNPIDGIKFNGSNNVLFLKSGVILHSDTQITFEGNRSLVFLGDSVIKVHSYYFNLSVFNDSVVFFGGNTYFNPNGEATHFKVAEMANLFVGRDSLFSTEINVETTDSHLLFDMIDGNLLRNNYAKDIVLENHVWIGRRVSLNKGSYIKSGTVVGNNAVVTKKFTEKNIVVVGVPAKEVKRNVFWRGNSTQKYDINSLNEWSSYELKSSEDYHCDFNVYIDKLTNENDLQKRFSKNLFILESLLVNGTLDVEKKDIDNFTKLFDFFSDKYSAEELSYATDSESNIHELAIRKKDKAAKFMYKNFLARDFIFYQHKNGISNFIKRSLYTPIELQQDSSNGLRKYGDTFFYFEYLGNRKTDKDEKRLLVIFSGMPADDYANDESLITRGGFPLFKNIKRSLVKDTYILRFVDANLASGSFYLNTPNYPDFEENIQKIIKIFANSYNIPSKNIVMFGASKGGFASLYHGLLGGYASVNSDPIINDNIYNNNGRDMHFQESFRQMDLIPRINDLLAQSDPSLKKFIIGNSYVKYTFKQYSKLNMANNGVVFYNTNDSFDNEHPVILRSAIPQVLAMINFLLDDKLSFN
ncbi:XcbB/CpsF family capsular polysaccharide biosynthesis protein [Weissella paramesenteroides]|uniref:XcbB/CpsF family capsular polysaccharide biosynthesis protein n=1 Tax=Weissella paramesenteroides TaxID=1249 RepID=UPI0023F720F4|nr:XcbB/CpsF family capsular polysaccharide biosynthesis protein [Weissella paramesenteroides]MDF8374205.1 XcbB/CpsF family capsular polysaccharide biosynthesis protein [Weissella paramesenteroides]